MDKRGQAVWNPSRLTLSLKHKNPAKLIATDSEVFVNVYLTYCHMTVYLLLKLNIVICHYKEQAYMI